MKLNAKAIRRAADKLAKKLGLNFKLNTIYLMDNYDLLIKMPDGSVHLMVIDPPYNTGEIQKGDDDEYDDRFPWDDEIHLPFLERLEQTHPRLASFIGDVMLDDEGLAAYLCWMAKWLIEAHRVLHEKGSIFVFQNRDASFEVKRLMGLIFGHNRFRAAVQWHRTSSSHNDAKNFGASHDTILYFTKGKQFTWNKVYLPHEPEYVKEHYTHNDKRGLYSTKPLTGAGSTKEGSSGKSWKGFDPPEGRHWSMPSKGLMCKYIQEHNLIPGWPEAYETAQDKLDALDAAGLIHWPKKEGGQPQLKHYLAASKGRPLQDMILHIHHVSGDEDTGYPTQKPVELIRLLIQSSSNEGDIVMDTCCGCGTTPKAAQDEGRFWVGCDNKVSTKRRILTRLMNKKAGWAEDMLEKTKDTDPGWLDRCLAAQGVQIDLEPPPAPPRDEQLPTAVAKREEKGKGGKHPFNKAQIKGMLLEEYGPICWGCGERFPNDHRNFQLDRIRPGADKGKYELDNCALLCKPCNGDKKHHATLSGLRYAKGHGSKDTPAWPDLNEVDDWAARELREAEARRKQHTP